MQTVDRDSASTPHTLLKYPLFAEKDRQFEIEFTDAGVEAFSFTFG
jgi:hypothetical protein